MYKALIDRLEADSFLTADEYLTLIENYKQISAYAAQRAVETKKKYYGRIFSKPFMTNQSGPYKGTPYRTFSNGAFVNGYSDHYPTYIVIQK